MNLPLVLCLAGVLQLSDQVAVRRDDNKTIDMDCDPTVSNRYDVCPTGYCCVRDEFLPTYVYCKKMGLHNEDCTTRSTESACPCVPGLHCISNIQGGGIHSLYGECKEVPGVVG